MFQDCINDKTFEELVEKFVNNALKYTSKGDKNILRFIGKILYHSGVENLQVIYDLFIQGYCYYFAKMLEDAFPGGEICQAYPYGHIVYVYDGIPYDINGICDYDVSDEDFIPISKININDFKHNKKED